MSSSTDYNNGETSGNKKKPPLTTTENQFG